MEKKTLTELYSKNLFQIPDYQRGYAWEEKQWNDFIQDLDALVNEEVKNHYTGTVVIYQNKSKSAINYGTTDKLEMVDVVDGQQRLTTACLYLSIIIRKLISKGESDYKQKIPLFLYASATCKLTLNNDTNGYFYDLLKTGHPNTTANSMHEKRLLKAYGYLEDHIVKQLTAKPESEVEYLRGLYDAITRKMVFTFYAIEEECEIGMTFELMNSRGKGLSVLELLKNYLMHWVSRNESNEADRSALTDIINKAWKDTYTNIGSCTGNEDQCLRIAWTLHCNHTPKNWAGYQGFKQDSYIPLRNFVIRTKEATKDFIIKFAEELAKISRHYACILSPTDTNTLSAEELIWLSKIHHTGNIANFLPLIVATRMHHENGSISASSYLEMLKALECFAYRVFLFEGKRSNAGQSSFYSWAYEILVRPQSTQSVTAGIYGLINYYSIEESFIEKTFKPANWYSRRHLLKYTLFEYELHLLSTEGKGKKPSLKWEQLDDSTIEHILPQTPAEHSHWAEVWNADDTKTYLHDIGNLVLTQNNSNYKNFEFERKKGMPGLGPSYSNSDIRQERKIAGFEDWHPADLVKRSQELYEWILNRWKVQTSEIALPEDINEQDDMDEGVGTQAVTPEAIPA